MKIALFGFSGFLGSHLLCHLKFEMISVNMRQIDWNNSIPKNVEIFINLIGKAHDHKGTATENDYYFANVELTKHIFQEFVKSDSKLFIHISSIAAVEEFESESPLKEQANSNPVSIYGKTKREAEKWLLEQKLPDHKKVIILRPAMIHGPGDKGNLGLLYKIISKGIPYPLASFDNNRSFLSIDNFCFFISEIIENKDRIDSGIYHICDDEPVSTKTVIGIIKKVTNKKTINLSIPKILIQGIAKIGDAIPFPINTKRLKKMTGSLLVSNEKIKNTLHIKTLPVSAEEGLFKTIKSFKNK
ncbi:nucleoside-diphosphate-sugar epimerase [Chryseobacterium rhizosphaerae]|jgi:nucleoside-diphosphate-sugar epimerase|uniref:NAD-dependent epimerase/dehydratase family protein n=1 Tax=Chryseobacterium rhizosphaerae TaxID=395937 RepID=UPI002857680F|nr:NAD-dependent epimerase/dehydratase family protein [Chryseobacterium rhizosphaerae]MDR6548097.1 nucleoside-diphosphate-sugar epimerase [Chryseobacterium rhizosphaerae]